MQINKAYIVLTIFLIIARIDAMQLNDTIVLVAKDGKEITFPKDFAQDSGTLSGLSENIFKEGESNRFEFRDIDPVDLNKAAEIAQTVHKLKNQSLHHKKLLDAISQQIKIPKSSKLLQVFDFLDYPVGKELVARAIAEDKNKAAYAVKTYPALAPLIAHYYFLLHGQDLPGVDPLSYGFSIQNYLDYQPNKINSAEMSLIFSNLRLNNFDGILNVPGITKATNLIFNKNQITKIPVGIFKGLAKLTWLSFSNNRLREITPDTFKGLAELKILDFSNNQLREIVPGTFTGLTRLTHLDLRNNRLEEIQPGAFTGLSGLDNLTLGGNQLKQIAPNTFTDLTRLTGLFLQQNQLTKIQVNAFNGLGVLENLNLSDNQLIKIPPGAFNGLIRLRYLELQKNLLDDATKKAIQSELPNTKVFF